MQGMEVAIKMDGIFPRTWDGCSKNIPDHQTEFKLA
jgi:hypothetical protein